jgi:hypothetical protein
MAGIIKTNPRNLRPSSVASAIQPRFGLDSSYGETARSEEDHGAEIREDKIDRERTMGYHGKRTMDLLSRNRSDSSHCRPGDGLVVIERYDRATGVVDAKRSPGAMSRQSSPVWKHALWKGGESYASFRECNYPYRSVK